MDVNLEFDMDIIEAIALGQVAVNAKMFAAQAVATILRTVDFLTSNKYLIRIQCTFPKDDPVMNLEFTVILVPVFMVVLAAVRSSGKLCEKTGFRFDRYLNSVGIVATMIYISIRTLVSRATALP